METENDRLRPKNKNYGTCAFCCLMLLLIVIGGLVFAIVYLTVIEPNQKAEEVPSTGPISGVCNSSACVSLAHTMLQRMDSSIEPCIHFYDYACGNWIKNTIIPEGHDQVTTMYSDIEQQRDLRVLLEAPAKDDGSEPEAIGKARTLYETCMDKDTREKNGVNVINGGVEAVFGGWPILENNPGGKFNADNFEMTTLMAGLYVHAGSTSILRPTVKYHDGTGQFQLEISAGKFATMPNFEYLVDAKYSKEQEAQLDYMTNAAHLLGANPAIARAEMGAVMNLETKLAEAKLMSEPSPDNVMTVREMQETYPNIDWMAFLTTLIPDTVVNVTDDFEVVNVDSEYLTKALDILDQEPPRLIADWMLWLCYHDAALYTNDAFRNIYYDFIKIVEGTPDREYYQDCVDLVQTRLPSITTRLYADNYLPTETQSMVNSIAEDIRTTLTNLIDRSSSFSDKSTAKSKVQEAEIGVGVPDYVRDNTTIDLEYENLNYTQPDIFVNFLTTLAWGIQQNVALLNPDNSEDDIQRFMGAAIDFGLTKPPVFNKEWPWYLNYGNLGTLIAGHLIGAVDHEETLDGSCLQNQYSKFLLLENGRTPLGEEADIIADNVGLQVATEFFMNQLNSRDRLTLTGVDLTVEQLFFLANAQQWCEIYSDEYADTVEGVTPGRFRVDGMMQNSAAFSEAFKCSANNRMNPSNKCVVL